MRMMKTVVMGTLAVMLTGCGEDKKIAEKAEVAVFASELALTVKPGGAVSVSEARANLKKGAGVTVIGDIGGSKKAFIGNRAAFFMVDKGSIKPAVKGDGGACGGKSCCPLTGNAAAAVLVQVKGPDGKVVKSTLEGWLGLKELSTVVVQGNYDQMSTKDNIIINATGIYVGK